MCSVIRKEFRLRNFWLNFDHPDCFTTTQWRWPLPVHLIYRFIMAGYTIFAFIHILVVVQDINDNNDTSTTNVTESPIIEVYPSMVYLTLWTYLLLACHFALAFIITAACYKKVRSMKSEPQLTSVTSSHSYRNSTFTPDDGLVKENQKSVKFDNNDNDLKTTDSSKTDLNQIQEEVTLPWYSKISWLLANILSVFAIIVTAIFFGALYTPSSGINLNDVNVHALNSVFIVVDNFISARPVRLFHVIYPIIYGATYVTFSAIYWGVDHRNVIYQGVLDWNYPGITMGAVVGIFAFITVLQLIHFGLYLLKLFIYKKMCRH